MNTLYLKFTVDFNTDLFDYMSFNLRLPYQSKNDFISSIKPNFGSISMSLLYLIVMKYKLFWKQVTKPALLHLDDST